MTLKLLILCTICTMAPPTIQPFSIAAQATLPGLDSDALMWLSGRITSEMEPYSASAPF